MNIEFDEKDGVYRIEPWKMLLHRYGLLVTSLLVYMIIVVFLYWFMRGDSYIRIGVVCAFACVMMSVVLGELRGLFAINIKMPSRHGIVPKDEIKKALKDVGLER